MADHLIDFIRFNKVGSSPATITNGMSCERPFVFKGRLLKKLSGRRLH